MSTRWFVLTKIKWLENGCNYYTYFRYPLYKKGAPQLRVFLPNFWMKLVKTGFDQPQNVVQFSCSMEMSRFDMKNYLEKIYNVKPVHIRTWIAFGKTRRDPGKGYIVKDDDIKYAFVTLVRYFEVPINLIIIILYYQCWNYKLFCFSKRMRNLSFQTCFPAIKIKNKKMNMKSHYNWLNKVLMSTNRKIKIDSLCQVGSQFKITASWLNR